MEDYEVIWSLRAANELDLIGERAGPFREAEADARGDDGLGKLGGGIVVGVLFFRRGQRGPHPERIGQCRGVGWRAERHCGKGARKDDRSGDLPPRNHCGLEPAKSMGREFFFTAARDLAAE